MTSSLLATRLRVPARPYRVVERAALLDALEHNVPQHRLTLVSAPAGYGKTTLLAQWADATHVPVAWLSLGDGDDDPNRFLRYLLKAWEAIDPDVRDSPVSWLLDSMAPDIDAVLSAVVNRAADIDDHVVFVIDDYHLVSDESVHRSVTFLLDNLPPALHVVLSSRADPPLPLSRYRARGELVEYRVEDLRFRLEESAEFLAGVMDLTLPNDQVVSLHDQLEGWAAGLQLAGLSLRRSPDSSEVLPVSGRQRYIADYLTEDVLDRLSGEVRRFLLETSVLSTLTGELCDRVTGEPGGQAMLNRLERENLFVVPLDDRREWFRYHRVFRDVLAETLRQREPGNVLELHRRAARWYLEHESPEPAFQHAVAAGDAEIAVQVCDLYTNAKLLAGELRIVGQWVRALPEDWYRRYPVLGLVRAGYMVYSGDVAGCLHCIDQVEETLTARNADDARWQMARVKTIRCFIACEMNDLDAAEEFAAQALQDFEEGDLGYRPGIYNALGDTYRRNGRWEEARTCYLKVLEFPNSPAVRIQSAHIYGALADLNLRQGQLREAERNWKDALTAIQGGDSWGVLPLPVIGWIYIRLAEILYEWNQLDTAAEYLNSGIDRVELGGDIRAMIAGYVLAGYLALAHGDVESAVEYRERARPLVDSSEFHEWTSRFERFQLEVWLARDQLRAAVEWADDMATTDAEPDGSDSDFAQLAMARVLIVKGDAVAMDRALAILEPLRAAAEAEQRTATWIEGLALRSLAEWQRDARSDALSSLEHALRLAAPEGYVRLFADLGLPMARLLQEARARDVMPDYVQRLLAAFGPGFAPSPAGEKSLPEPLTDREREILGLLAAGLTNGEIAEKLFISAETVKKHSGNIYGKLGVRSRTEAASRARALELLE